MPRVAKTNPDGQAVFITDDIKLPVTDAATRNTDELLHGIENQLKLLNARIEECFNTAIPLE